MQRNSAVGNRQLKRRRRAFLTLVVFVAMRAAGLPVPAESPVRKNILIITGESETHPGIAMINQQIREKLSRNPNYDFEFFLESLDSETFQDTPSRRQIQDSILRKYRDIPIDVIVASGPQPVQFLSASSEPPFADIPIVICAVTADMPGTTGLDSRFTGARISLEPAATLNAALRLFPKTKYVAIVAGTSDYDRARLASTRADLQAFKSHLDFIDLTGLEMQVLLERLRQLPPNTVVLYSTLFRDGAGKLFVNATTALPMVAQAANGPVFGMSASTLGQGIVGGKLVNFSNQGTIVAGLITELLAGKKPEELPIAIAPNSYMFDWRELKRWKINEHNLPQGSLILYRQPTLWQQHKWPLIDISLATFLLVLMGGYLLIERWRRRVAETELEVERTFERLISELSTYLIDLPADKVDSGIDSALNRVAGSLAIDRISILEFMMHGRELLMTHSSGGQSSAMLGRALKSEDFPYVVGKLSKNETLVFSNPEQCLGMSVEELELIRWRGIQAAVFVPLEARGTVMGVLSFVSQQESKWSNNLVEHCRTLGQSFANALVRQRAEEALLTSEQLKSAILISLNSNVIVADRNGEILSINSSIEPDLLYRSADSAPEFRVGANCLEIYQRSSRAGNAIASKIMNGIKAVLEGARPRFELEWVSDFKEGRKWVMTSVTPLEMKSGGLVITHTEITDRKQAEEERLELSGRLIDMQEKERSRLARELHDDFNQRLAVLAIDLERASQTIDDSPDVARQRLHELWNRASEIGTDLHSLSHRLHSSTLESLGLVHGVSSLCAEFEEQQGIQVDFTHENIARSVSPDIALCLFRVAQEGLRNVKRHSGASRAEIRLEAAEQEISLSISDAGIGFDSRTSRARDGLGIRSMQERLRLLGGRFEISSQPGEGTVIHVSIPLNGPALIPVNGPALIPFRANTNSVSYRQA